ncbi:MAG: hypothetical protein NC429_04650 [Lachnospiraceae bacterium]|nr:hypothetical protein [Lachnospiraceae bacterium]
MEGSFGAGAVNGAGLSWYAGGQAGNSQVSAHALSPLTDRVLNGIFRRNR